MAQQNPKTVRENVTPRAREEFLHLLAEREQRGIQTYGTTLQTHNGRDPFQDAKEELLDLWQYLIQAEMETNDLRQQLADAIKRAERAEVEAVTLHKVVTTLDKTVCSSWCSGQPHCEECSVNKTFSDIADTLSNGVGAEFLADAES